MARRRRRRRRRRFWIRKAIKKPGALRRALRIPAEKKIPTKLLRRITKAKAGQTITNPTRVGKRRIRVTRLLERRAILALILRGLPRRGR